MRRLGLLGGFAMAVGALIVAGGIAKEDKATEVKVGDKAPVFEGTDDQGKEWKSSDHVGKKVLVVYFFPAALTGG